MTYNDALALINAQIVTNGNNEITALVLNPVLKAMIDFPNDVIGVLADLDTTDTTTIVNAINSIISENLPNATALRPIDTTGVDFDQDELAWVADSVNNTIANNGNFTCQLGQQMVFYCDVLISSDGSEAIYQRRYYRLLTGAVLVSAVSESDLMPDGIEARTLDLTGALVIDLGDIGTDDVEDAFNSDPNQPFAISGDKFIKAVQSTVDKLWYWIGGDGNFGNSATLAEATDFVDLTDGASPPVAAIYSFTDLIDTPANYSGQANKTVTVKADETGLEFITPSGGGGDLEFQTVTTVATTVLDGTQKGLNKVYPFDRATAQTIEIQVDDYVENDVINIERRGEGTVEILQGTDVRFRGVRDSENRFFINDPNSIVSLLCRGVVGSNDEFTIIGRLKGGYTGAVLTSSYGVLAEGDVNKSVNVVGVGFSENMLVTVSANATLVSWDFVDNNNITLYLTAVGVETDTVNVTYDNGQITTDVNAITIAASNPYLYDVYAFQIGTALFQLNSAITYGIRVRRSSDDAQTDVGFDTNRRIGLSSPVSAGGDLTTWAGADDVFVVTRYNQGSLGATGDVTQATTTSQPKLLSAGAMYNLDGNDFVYYDGGDYLATSGELALGDTDLTLFSNTRLATITGSLNINSCFNNSGNRCFQLTKQISTGFRFFIQTSTTLMSVTSDTPSIDTNYKLAAHYNATDINVYVNGAGATPVAVTGTYTAFDYNYQEGAYGPGTAPLIGYNNYNIVFKTDQSSNIAAIQAIIDLYL